MRTVHTANSFENIAKLFIFLNEFKGNCFHLAISINETCINELTAQFKAAFMDLSIICRAMASVICSFEN